MRIIETMNDARSIITEQVTHSVCPRLWCQPQILLFACDVHPLEAECFILCTESLKDKAMPDDMQRAGEESTAL